MGNEQSSGTGGEQSKGKRKVETNADAGEEIPYASYSKEVGTENEAEEREGKIITVTSFTEKKRLEGRKEQVEPDVARLRELAPMEPLIKSSTETQFSWSKLLGAPAEENLDVVTGEHMVGIMGRYKNYLRVCSKEVCRRQGILRTSMGALEVAGNNVLYRTAFKVSDLKGFGKQADNNLARINEQLRQVNAHVARIMQGLDELRLVLPEEDRPPRFEMDAQDDSEDTTTT